MFSEDTAPKVPLWSRRYGMLLALGALAISLVYLSSSDRPSRERETAAVAALRELGAIIVMDSNHQCAASVNLSTLQAPEAPEALEQALAHLPALTHLTALDASRTPIRDEQLDLISELPSLNSLSLNSTAISDGGVERLTNLKNLRAVFLVSTQITDRSLAALGTLRPLRMVDISETKVTDGLQPFVQLPHLDWLVLRNLTLTDNALIELCDCSSLRRLSLEGSTYSADSLSALEEAQPQITIDQ